jgi:hypothetical protein
MSTFAKISIFPSTRLVGPFPVTDAGTPPEPKAVFVTIHADVSTFKYVVIWRSINPLQSVSVIIRVFKTDPGFMIFTTTSAHKKAFA